MHTLGKYILYFLIYSVLGGIVETLFRLVTEHRLYGVDGFLHLPLFPIYGFGALLIIVVLGSRVRHPVPLFFAGALLATLLEFAAHWLIEVVFGDRIWGYGSGPLSFDGRTSLYSSVGFGLAAVALVHVIHPWVAKVIGRIPKRPTVVIAALVLIVLLTDFVVSAVERLSN